MPKQAVFQNNPSDHFRSEAHDLRKAAFAQFARHRAEHAGADRLAVGLDQHGGVLVEADVGAVLAADLLTGADDDGLDDLVLLNRAVRGGLFDRGGGPSAAPSRPTPRAPPKAES